MFSEKLFLLFLSGPVHCMEPGPNPVSATIRKHDFCVIFTELYDKFLSLKPAIIATKHWYRFIASPRVFVAKHRPWRPQLRQLTPTSSWP